MTIKVLNKKWKIVVRSDKVHNAKHPNSHAVAVLEDRRIYVRRSSLDIETITHELVHAYSHELSLVEIGLDTEDQFEEFFCELFAKYGEIIVKDARRVLTYFKK